MWEDHVYAPLKHTWPRPPLLRFPCRLRSSSAPILSDPLKKNKQTQTTPVSKWNCFRQAYNRSLCSSLTSLSKDNSGALSTAGINPFCRGFPFLLQSFGHNGATEAWYEPAVSGLPCDLRFEVWQCALVLMQSQSFEVRAFGLRAWAWVYITIRIQVPKCDGIRSQQPLQL